MAKGVKKEEGFEKPVTPREFSFERTETGLYKVKTNVGEVPFELRQLWTTENKVKQAIQFYRESRGSANS